MYQLDTLPSASASPRARDIGAGLLGVVGLCLLGLSGIVLAGLYLPQTAAHSYWLIARSSGLVAYLLITLGTLWGLVQSGGLWRRRVAPLLALGLHSYLSWLGLGLALLHGLILLGDSYIHFDLARVLVPFISDYRPLPVGLGIISFYLMLLLSLSFYARPYVSQRAFRALHYASFAAFVAVTAHGIYAGSDSGALWWLYAASGAAVAALTLARVVATRRAQPRPAA